MRNSRWWSFSFFETSIFDHHHRLRTFFCLWPLHGLPGGGGVVWFSLEVDRGFDEPLALSKDEGPTRKRKRNDIAIMAMLGSLIATTTATCALVVALIVSCTPTIISAMAFT